MAQTNKNYNQNAVLISNSSYEPDKLRKDKGTLTPNSGNVTQQISVRIAYSIL